MLSYEEAEHQFLAADFPDHYAHAMRFFFTSSKVHSWSNQCQQRFTANLFRKTRA
jgi:hypothetical protein